MSVEGSGNFIAIGDIGRKIPTKEFPQNWVDGLSKYRTDYHPFPSVIVRQTNTDGLERVLKDRTWHSSRPLSIESGSLLVVENGELPAVPGPNILYFEVTETPITLTPQQAETEWRKSPFRTESFARDHGFFPHILPNLRPLSKQELLEKYFQTPSQEMMDDWVKKAREISGGANCFKRKFGALIIDDGRVVAAGTNYTYSGYEEVECVPCIRENIASGTRVEVCRAIHAEQDVVVNALNRAARLLFGILVVAGQEPDGSAFMNPRFYCTVCARILNETHGLLGVVTDTKDGAKFRPMEKIVKESFDHLQTTEPSLFELHHPNFSQLKKDN